MGGEPTLDGLVDQPAGDVVSHHEVLMQNGTGEHRCFERRVEILAELASRPGRLEDCHDRPDHLLHEVTLGDAERGIPSRVPRKRAEHGPDVAGTEAEAQIAERRVQVVSDPADARAWLVRDGQRVDRREQQAALIRPVPVHRGASHISVIGDAGGGDLVSPLRQQHLDRRVEHDPAHATGPGVHALVGCVCLTGHGGPLD